MRKIYGWPFLALFGLFLFWACKKNIAEDTENNNNQEQNTGSPSHTNPRLSYGDTLFYLKNQPGNYTILPVSVPAASGFFKAIPAGLVLDSVSGRINITLSETGLRYKVYYVSPGGTAIDSVKLVISGVDYQDAIYTIASTADVYDTAFPIYNARPGLPLPCGGDDEDDDGDIDDDDNLCVFDETDLDDDGNDDIPGVIQDKLLVDTKKGTIDVEASFYAGLFGSSNPANGVSKDFTFYYRLQDASNRALNKITVRFYHYRTISDIPQSLLDTLNLRNQIGIAVNSRTASNRGNSAFHANAAGHSDFTAGRMESFALYESKPKRPPIIIIVSQ